MLGAISRSRERGLSLHAASHVHEDPTSNELVQVPLDCGPDSCHKPFGTARVSVFTVVLCSLRKRALLQAHSCQNARISDLIQEPSHGGRGLHIHKRIPASHSPAIFSGIFNNLGALLCKEQRPFGSDKIFDQRCDRKRRRFTQRWFASGLVAALMESARLMRLLDDFEHPRE